MIISPGRRYVFVHIPKTGGTSLALALEGRAMKDDILIGDTPKAKRRKGRLRDVRTRGRLWKHSTLADIDGLVSVDQLDTLFTFALVRNPWDRAVSYYHWLQVQRFDHPAVALSQSHDFEAFITHPATMASFERSTARSYMIRADGKEQDALFVRLEHLAQDAEPLFEHLGFRLDLPHENRSDRCPDYRSYYSDQSAEAVAQSCTEDIARFGYRFDEPSGVVA